MVFKKTVRLLSNKKAEDVEYKMCHKCEVVYLETLMCEMKVIGVAPRCDCEIN